MVIDRFNMVDMEGVDLIESQGLEVPGLYQKLVESIAQCRYTVLYNWQFNKIVIPPTPVELTVEDEEVKINEEISVTNDDIIVIRSIQEEPNIQSLYVEENGEYSVEPGVDGYNPVTVNVRSIFFQLDRDPTASDGQIGDYCLSRSRVDADGFVIRVNIAARGSSTSFNYWGTSAFRVVLEDSQGNDVSITDLRNYSICLSSPNIVSDTTPRNALFTQAPTGSYFEKSNLPGYFVIKADSISNYKLKSVSFCRRPSESYVDYVVSFDIFWIKDNAIIGDPVLSVSGLTQNDWPYGQLVEFIVNSYTPEGYKLFYKTDTGWVQIL